MSGVNVIIFTDNMAKLFSRAAGAYRLATELRKAGYTVQVIDHLLLLGLNRTLKLLDKFVGSETLFVGFSTTFMNVNEDYIRTKSNRFSYEDKLSKSRFLNSMRYASVGLPIIDAELKSIKDKIKTINPKAKLVLGGARIVTQDFFQSYFDAYIFGYADATIVEYAKFLEEKKPFFQSKKLKNGALLVDYDLEAKTFNFSDSKIEYHESDKILSEEVLPIEIARGCIFKCKFCAFRLNGKGKFDYMKSQDILYEEFLTNYEKFGTTHYLFCDDTYNDSIQKLEYIAKIVQRLPFKIQYTAYIRHDLIARFPDMADLLKESGLKSALFGIETLNPSAGKIIGKGLSKEKTRNVLQWLRDDKGWKNNIMMSSGFIAGLPTETPETVTAWAEELLDFSFPLDSFILNYLQIKESEGESSTINKNYKPLSEFDKNYKAYGYWFDPSKSAGWINEHWQYEDASKLGTEISIYAHRVGRCKVFGFDPVVLHNYGLSNNQIHASPAHLLLKDKFKTTVLHTDNYYARLMS